MAQPCQRRARPQSRRAGEGWGSAGLGCPDSLGEAEDKIRVRSTGESFESQAFLPGRKEKVGNFTGTFICLLGLRLRMSP